MMGLMFNGGSYKNFVKSDTNTTSSSNSRLTNDIPQYLQKYFTKKEFNKAVKDSLKPLDVVKTLSKVGV
jgi:hypothetical protein